MTKTAISPKFRGEGFTLIELLIVIVVMAILVTLLVPTINRIIVSADNRRSQAFVQDVARAADAFKGQNNGRYPGQDDIGLLKGTIPDAGPYTGSQIIAARLFDYPNTEIDTTPVAGVSATSKYLEYKSYLLIERSDEKNSLADDSRTSNVLLYFPSRLNVVVPSDDAASKCYRWGDNSVYVGEFPPDEFINCIADERFSGENASDDVKKKYPRNPGGILIIGTGANDIYMDDDDIKSWEID